MNEIYIGLIVITALAIFGAYQITVSSRRSALDVLGDLEDEEAVTSNSGQKTLSGLKLGRQKLVINDEFGKAGLFTAEERKNFKLKCRLTPLIFAAIFLILKLLFIPGPTSSVIVITLVGAGIGYLVQKDALRRKAKLYQRDLEFYLPIVMERLVMAVQSGLDILAGMNAIIGLQKNKSEIKNLDPVTRLLDVVYRFTESGLGFQTALHEVAAVVECSAVRHAFIHLAVAHEEGGELIVPLKELSDSTQLYFQETVDEEIAKLPIKATLPLLLTFTGLIICFITSPLIQIITLMQKQLAGLH